MYSFRKSNAYRPKRNKVLDEFGSNINCRACGSEKLHRLYQAVSWVCPEHMLVICTNCGCHDWEKLKGVKDA